MTTECSTCSGAGSINGRTCSCLTARSNVTPIRAALSPDNVLEQAKGQYESVLVLGYDHTGELDARASLNLKTTDIVFIVEMFKLLLLNGAYKE